MVCMHEHNHFILGCFVDTMQSPCGQGAYTLAEKETRKRTKNYYIEVVKIQQAAANNITCFEYLFLFFKEPAEKKKKK